ncbi:MAG: hypothetical protein JW953_04160, partial [Anaerolineae bacterium]|nr:hypothetical protein [Anaerolineae bacterium]
QEIIHRTLQRHQRQEWKTRGRQGTYFGGAMLWGVAQADPQGSQVRITSVTPSGEDDTFYYVLETDAVGGLLLYNWQQDSERRLFHKESFWVRELDYHPEDNALICAQYFPNGTANLARLKGYTLQEITEGDSVDAAPSWVLAQKEQIVFQSAGVGRNANGYPIGLGPFCVELLNLKTGRLTTLLDDPQYDFLLPHMTAAGDLYFIRRPYESDSGGKYSFLNFITDILLFPFRLLRAIFHFLDFISLTFSKKRLTMAGGPKVEGEDEKTILLRGKIIEAQKVLREGTGDKETPALVPDSWELVKQQTNGEETILARGVVAFDLDAKGNLIYTNGSAVYSLDKTNKPQRLLKGKLIQDVVIV